MSGEINVIALVRGEEQYIFMFDEANRTETLRMLGRYAANPELSFTWYDAAIMSQKVREMLPAKAMQPAPASNSNSQASASLPSSSEQSLTKPSTKNKATQNPPRFKRF